MNVLDSCGVTPGPAQAAPAAASTRRDAVRNRSAIVAAAERVFAAEGAHAPLARVAHEAGVGRATVQRHFPDRYALAAAVYGRNLDDVEAWAARHADAPGALDEVVRRVVDGQRRAAGLFPRMRSDAAAAPYLDALGRRLDTLLTAPTAAAVARGEIAAGTTVADVQLVLAMAEGLLASYDGEERTRALDRGLRIALAGLREPSTTATGTSAS